MHPSHVSRTHPTSGYVYVYVHVYALHVCMYTHAPYLRTLATAPAAARCSFSSSSSLRPDAAAAVAVAAAVAAAVASLVAVAPGVASGRDETAPEADPARGACRN